MATRPLKILQIAYYYPPMGGAGVQRGLKFSRYLPLHGVTPVVLAAHDVHYVQDASLLAEAPADVEVHRVAHSPLLARLAAWRRGAGAGAGAGTDGGPDAGASSTVAPAAPTAMSTTATIAAPAAAPGRGSAPDGRARLLHALRDAALRSWRAAQWPDDMAPWARRALMQARRIIAAHAAGGQPIELVFSSAPPASAHWLGERIAREANLPWVADFRDLWTDNPAYDMPAWRRLLDCRLESRWLRRASGVVTVTPSWRDMLAARRPAGAPTAFIPNGYDESDFAGLSPLPHEPATFTLVHTGTFYGPRDPAGLLDGLTRYLSGDTTGLPRLRVRLVGNMGARFAQALRAFDQRHPGVVQVLPYLPHAQALAELMAADALLLVVGGGRGPATSGWLPGKIFEYLRSGKPVLTLGDPAGDAAVLVGRYAQGWVRQDDDAAGIAQALAQLVRAASAGAGAAPTAAPTASPAIFERRELSRQLADFLRQCAARHGRVHG